MSGLLLEPGSSWESHPFSEYIDFINSKILLPPIKISLDGQISITVNSDFDDLVTQCMIYITVPI